MHKQTVTSSTVVTGYHKTDREYKTTILPIINKRRHATRHSHVGTGSTASFETLAPLPLTSTDDDGLKLVP